MRRLLVLAMSLAFTAAACDSSSTGPQGALSGTYSLRSINGVQTSPWVIYNDGTYKQEVLSSTITLDASGNYSSLTVFRDTYTGQPPAQYNDVITGYWTLQGNSLTLTDTTDPTLPVNYYGTVQGSTITLSDGSVGTQVYSK